MRLIVGQKQQKIRPQLMGLGEAIGGQDALREWTQQQDRAQKQYATGIKSISVFHGSIVPSVWVNLLVAPTF